MSWVIRAYLYTNPLFYYSFILIITEDYVSYKIMRIKHSHVTIYLSYFTYLRNFSLQDDKSDLFPENLNILFNKRYLFRIQIPSTILLNIVKSITRINNDDQFIN